MPTPKIYFFYAVALGFLTMTGPVAIDLFLPAIPIIAESFHISTVSVELSLTAIFAGNALGQLVYGPLSDRFGRKPIILSAMLIYFISAIGSGFASNIETLIVWRFIQGLIMASGRILANAVARDLYNEERLTKLITLIMFVSIFSSIGSAPFGGYLSEKYSWQTIFWFMSFYAVGTFLIFLFFFKETIPAKDYKALNINDLINNFSMVISNRQFYLNVICGGFALGGIVAYLNSSSGVLIKGFGLSPFIFGLTFSAVIASQAAATLIAGKLIDHVDRNRLMKFSSLIVACAGVTMFVLSINNVNHAAAVTVPMIVFAMGFAILWPQTVSACLDPFPMNAGTASTLQGFIQNSMATLVSAILSIFSGSLAIPMSTAIAGSGILAFCTCILSLKLANR